MTVTTRRFRSALLALLLSSSLLISTIGAPLPALAAGAAGLHDPQIAAAVVANRGIDDRLTQRMGGIVPQAQGLLRQLPRRAIPRPGTE